jgi:hypothetical protein
LISELGELAAKILLRASHKNTPIIFLLMGIYEKLKLNSNIRFSASPEAKYH